MNKQICREIVVYKIQPDKLDVFESIKTKLMSETKSLPGLVSSTTSAHATDKDIFVDTMIWESVKHSKAAHPEFEALSNTKQFMSLMAGPPLYHGVFTELAQG